VPRTVGNARAKAHTGERLQFRAGAASLPLDLDGSCVLPSLMPAAADLLFSSSFSWGRPVRCYWLWLTLSIAFPPCRSLFSFQSGHPMSMVLETKPRGAHSHAASRPKCSVYGQGTHQVNVVASSARASTATATRDPPPDWVIGSLAHTTQLVNWRWSSSIQCRCRCRCIQELAIRIVSFQRRNSCKIPVELLELAVHAAAVPFARLSPPPRSTPVGPSVRSATRLARLLALRASPTVDPHASEEGIWSITKKEKQKIYRASEIRRDKLAQFSKSL